MTNVENKLKELNENSISLFTWGKFYVDKITTYSFVWEGFNNTPFIYMTDDEYDSHKRLNLLVPYESKDEVKSLGANWDSDIKKWYIYANNKNITKMINKWKIHSINFRYILYEPIERYKHVTYSSDDRTRIITSYINNI